MSFVNFFQGLDNIVFGAGAGAGAGARGVTNATNQAGRSWFNFAPSEADTFVKNFLAQSEATPVHQQVHTDFLENLALEEQKASEQNFITSGLMALTVGIAAVGAGLHIAPVMAAAALGPASWFLGKGAVSNYIGQFLKKIQPDIVNKVAQESQEEIFKMTAQNFLVKQAQKLGIQLGKG
ncbi:MAG: hypothetical protein VKK59_06675 [Vampirovibrionales bacterium]|nr:hypothetical protein [Vampirovibrionales bacterium]